MQRNQIRQSITRHISQGNRTGQDAQIRIGIKFHSPECAVTIIDQQHLVSDIGYHKIIEPILIPISGGNANGVSLIVGFGGFCYPCELTANVPIQQVG